MRTQRRGGGGGVTMTVTVTTMGPTPARGRMWDLTKEGVGRGGILRDIVWQWYVQVGVGNTSVIKRLVLRNALQIQFYASLNACFMPFLNTFLQSFDVITVENKLCPIVISYHCFIRLRRLFYLAWHIGASVGSTKSLVHGIIFSSS